jgi:hypothetical protein
MPKTRWPDDHPNARVLQFVETSRVVLERAQKTPIVESTATLLDRIEALIDEMGVGRTVAEINALVAQVGPLTNEAVARMNIISTQRDVPT